MHGLSLGRGIFGVSQCSSTPSQIHNSYRFSVGRQIVNVPSFVVRLDSQKHIDFALTSPYGGGGPGRVKRKRAAAAAKKEEGGDDEDEE